ncbi:MAG: glycosyltransferase family 4 protein, partial [Thermoplasmata archaeon]
MKVTIVAGRNPFAAKASGTSTYVEGLVTALNEERLHVTLISCEIDKKTADRYNLNHISLKMKKVTSIRFLLKLLVKTPRLKIPEYSIIHTHRPDFMFPFILFCRKNPKVCTLHGIPDIGIKTRKNFLTWGIYSLLERSILGRINRLIAVNQSTKDYYAQKYPRIKDKIAVIPVGVDLDLFRPLDREKMRKRYGFNQEDKIILYVGRFSVEKGLDLLLSAFKELKSEVGGVRLILLGEGMMEEKLRKIVKSQNIEDVTFMKPHDHKKIPEILNCADLLALCSSYEGMPTIVLEALACGVPVVSTDVGDVKNMVLEDKTGQLVPSRDSKSIKN